MLKHYKALSLCAAVAMTSLSLIAVTPAQAKSDPVVITGQRVSDLPTQRVSFADLNLAAAADQVTLERRVGSAVKQVCVASGYTIEANLRARASYSGCSDFAWDGARPQIAAAIARTQAVALNGIGSDAAASLAITVSAPAGA
jgi:UrcA family protein